MSISKTATTRNLFNVIKKHIIPSTLAIGICIGSSATAYLLLNEPNETTERSKEWYILNSNGIKIIYLNGSQTTILPNRDSVYSESYEPFIYVDEGNGFSSINIEDNTVVGPLVISHRSNTYSYAKLDASFIGPYIDPNTHQTIFTETYNPTLQIVED